MKSHFEMIFATWHEGSTDMHRLPPKSLLPNSAPWPLLKSRDLLSLLPFFRLMIIYPPNLLAYSFELASITIRFGISILFHSPYYTRERKSLFSSSDIYAESASPGWDSFSFSNR